MKLYMFEKNQESGSAKSGWTRSEENWARIGMYIKDRIKVYTNKINNPRTWFGFLSISFYRFDFDFIVAGVGKFSSTEFARNVIRDFTIGLRFGHFIVARLCKFSPTKSARNVIRDFTIGLRRRHGRF